MGCHLVQAHSSDRESGRFSTKHFVSSKALLLFPFSRYLSSKSEPISFSVVSVFNQELVSKETQLSCFKVQLAEWRECLGILYRTFHISASGRNKIDHARCYWVCKRGVDKSVQVSMMPPHCCGEAKI
jgi:hypothetical protein